MKVELTSLCGLLIDFSGTLFDYRTVIQPEKIAKLALEGDTYFVTDPKGSCFCLRLLEIYQRIDFLHNSTKRAEHE